MFGSIEHLEDGLFGLPRILTPQETASLQRALTTLWTSSYGQPPGSLESDLQLCRRYFDPVARGARLREVLAALPSSPAVPSSLQCWLVEPLVVRIDHARVLVGPEARLTLELLHASPAEETAFSDADRAEIYRQLALLYRGWSRHRLDQVISLRAGQGREVMQAIAVGFVIALLVNRSNSPQRALHITDADRAEGSVDAAVFAAADAFAQNISGRNERSAAQHRLKGGYGVSEARRRLGELLHDRGGLLYVTPGRANDVVLFLARDLARRNRLNREVLQHGLHDLVETYRRTFAEMALTVRSHERPADTAALVDELLEVFTHAKGK